MTFADIFRLFSTMDAYQRLSFFFICTLNFPQVNMREEKKVCVDETDEEKAKCQNVLC